MKFCKDANMGTNAVLTFHFMPLWILLSLFFKKRFTPQNSSWNFIEMHIRSRSCVLYNYGCFLILSYDPLIVVCVYFCNLLSCTCHNSLRISHDDMLFTRISVPSFYVWKWCPNCLSKSAYITTLSEILFHICLQCFILASNAYGM